MAGVIENIGLKFDFKAHFQYVFVSHKHYRRIIILTQKIIVSQLNLMFALI